MVGTRGTSGGAGRRRYLSGTTELAVVGTALPCPLESAGLGLLSPSGWTCQPNNPPPTASRAGPSSAITSSEVATMRRNRRPLGPPQERSGRRGPPRGTATRHHGVASLSRLLPALSPRTSLTTGCCAVTLDHGVDDPRLSTLRLRRGLERRHSRWRCGTLCHRRAPSTARGRTARCAAGLEPRAGCFTRGISPDPARWPGSPHAARAISQGTGSLPRRFILGHADCNLTNRSPALVVSRLGSSSSKASGVEASQDDTFRSAHGQMSR